jgi:hypothetical protein
MGVIIQEYGGVQTPLLGRDLEANSGRTAVAL